MSTYILNGFSFLMSKPDSGLLAYHRISASEARLQCIDAKACIGNLGLANVLSDEFGFPVEYNPCSIELKPGDVFIIAYITGGKLLPTDVKRPRNVVIEYYCAKILEEL